MIIECINCSRKFNLNEHILDPNGSKVRCTKCGQIFCASPTYLDRYKQSLPTENEMATIEVNNHKTDAASGEQRIGHRIKVSVPASCISTDADGNPLDFNIGRITDVSQENIAIEIFCISSFEYSSLSFITLDDKEIQIKGKVARTKRNALGKRKIELSLIGTPREIADFVSQLVRYHHHATRPVDKVQGKEKDQPAISCSGWAT
jgi:predicted Zn finger-like uncharacterized protein